MTDIFRWDVLAVVMQQIVDEPTLPVLFMRTVRFFFLVSSFTVTALTP
jgi:symplekin